MKTKLLLPLVPLVVSVSIAEAQLVFEENFNSNTLGTSLASTANWSENGGNNAARFANNIADASDLFGQGTSNVIAEVGMNNPGGTHTVTTSTSFGLDQGQILFSFYEPDVTDDAIGLYFRDGGLATQDLSFDDGTLSGEGGNSTSYTLDALNDIRIVFNLTAGALGYDSGAGTVASKTYDVYLNNTIVFNDVAIIGGATTFIDEIAFNKAAGTTSTMYFDNFLVSSDLTAVPEPSAYALIAGSLALGWIMTRRRRS